MKTKASFAVRFTKLASCWICAGLVTGFGLDQARASFWIDSFNQAPQSISLVPGEADSAFNSANAGPSSDPLWSERDVLVERTVGGGATDLDVTYSVSDAMSFGAGAFTEARATLTWDGADNHRAVALDGLAVNLTAGGNDRVSFLAGSDFGSTVEITVFTSLNQWSKGTVSVSGAGSPEYSLTSYSLPFASGFSTVGPAGAADFSQVEAIQMVVNVGKAGQVTIDNLMATDSNLTPVPEPGTVLAGIGAVGILLAGVLRRGRK